MEDFPEPVVVLSNCLEFSACRYNGQVIPDSFVKRLGSHVKFVPVCPEVEIGLGIPRDPIRIIEHEGRITLFQPATGRDISKKMDMFANRYLNNLEGVDGFILKSRSPSCGIKDVKIFPNNNNSPSLGKTAGFFAKKVLEKFPGLAIEDEGRLTNFKIREYFLTKLFLLARFRLVKQKKTVQELIRFHTQNKFLIMSYNQSVLRVLGRIVANSNKDNINEVYRGYEDNLLKAFSHASKKTSNINVLMHALGYFSNYLKQGEKSHFLDELEKYRDGRHPLSAFLMLIRSWIIRFEEKYLDQQTYFVPYPLELVEISDSGKGRDI